LSRQTSSFYLKIYLFNDAENRSNADRGFLGREFASVRSASTKEANKLGAAMAIYEGLVMLPLAMSPSSARI
jgi:hypothetical protein